MCKIQGELKFTDDIDVKNGSLLFSQKGYTISYDKKTSKILFQKEITSSNQEVRKQEYHSIKEMLKNLQRFFKLYSIKTEIPDNGISIFSDGEKKFQENTIKIPSTFCLYKKKKILLPDLFSLTFIQNLAEDDCFVETYCYLEDLKFSKSLEAKTILAYEFVKRMIKRKKFTERESKEETKKLFEERREKFIKTMNNPNIAIGFHKECDDDFVPYIMSIMNKHSIQNRDVILLSFFRNIAAHAHENHSLSYQVINKMVNQTKDVVKDIIQMIQKEVGTYYKIPDFLVETNEIITSNN